MPKSKKDSKTKRLNKNTAVVPVNEDLPAEQELSREDKFIEYLFTEKNLRNAGLKAGYSKSYCDTQLGMKLQSPKVQEKIKKYFLKTRIMCLPKIGQVYDLALEHLTTGNIKDYSKFAAIDKKILQVLGLLGQDQGPPTPTIDIKSVRTLMLNLIQQPGQLPEPSQDAEVVEE